MTSDEANRLWEELARLSEAGEFDRAEAAADRLVEHFAAAGKTGNHALCLQRKAMVCESLGRIHEANAYHRQAYLLCAGRRLAFAPVVALNASLCLERSGNPENALALLREAAEGAAESSEGFVEVYRRLAALDPDPAACRRFVADSLGKRSADERLAVAQALGSDCFERRDFRQALEYYRLAEDDALAGLAAFAVYEAIGICHSRLAEHGRAIAYLQSAGIIALKEGDPYAIAALNLNLGIAYVENGQRAEAAARLSDAHALATEHGFADVLAQMDAMAAKGLLAIDPR